MHNLFVNTNVKVNLEYSVIVLFNYLKYITWNQTKKNIRKFTTSHYIEWDTPGNYYWAIFSIVPFKAYLKSCNDRKHERFIKFHNCMYHFTLWKGWKGFDGY